jgi:outer membrane protein
MRKSMYKMMIMLVVVFIGWVGFAGNVLAQSATIKIGFVDLQRVIDSSEQGKNAHEAIQKKADDLNHQAKKLKDEIQAMRDDYDKQADLLTIEAKAEKQDAIAKKELDYNRFVKDSQTELKMAEQRALKQLLEDVGALVVKYGKENGYTVILEAGNILYGAENIELTNEIIKVYNAQKK